MKGTAQKKTKASVTEAMKAVELKIKELDVKIGDLDIKVDPTDNELEELMKFIKERARLQAKRDSLEEWLVEHYNQTPYFKRYW